MVNDRTYLSKDTAILDWEAKCIAGGGILSSTKMLRNLGYNSIYEKAFLAAADRIEELEAKLNDARCEAWKWKNQWETLKYGDY